MNKLYLIKMFTVFCSLLIMTVSCTQADATLSQAKRELPFPVIFPENVLEDWAIEETIYEDRLLVTTFKNSEEGRIELVQDQNIQGLDVEQLRNYVLSNDTPNTEFTKIQEIMEVNDYVGELAYFMEPIPTVQFTFVSKNDLFADVNGNIPYYQLIGKEVSTEELRKFIYTLEVIT